MSTRTIALAWALLSAAALAAVALLYWWAGSWSGPPSPAPAVEAARLAAVASNRGGVITAGVGLVAVGTVAVNARTLRYTSRTVGVAERGLLADRYAKAIELLGGESVDAVVGGVYALEQFARDSDPADRATMVEVLSAFVRRRCPLTADEREHLDYLDEQLELMGDDDPVPPWAVLSPAPELDPAAAAALSVLGRLDHESVPARCDLRRCLLDGAQLLDAVMPGALLSDSQIAFADLTRADLTGALLRDTVLTKGCLRGANLQQSSLTGAYAPGAEFAGARLVGASLVGARLDHARMASVVATGANFANAVLTRAILHSAQLDDAQLDDAQLDYANLRGVVEDAALEEAFFRGARLHGARLRGAKLVGARFAGADLLDADLTRANVRGADFAGVHNLTQQQIDQAEGNRQTRLPEGLRHPPHWRFRPAPSRTSDDRALDEHDSDPTRGPRQ